MDGLNAIRRRVIACIVCVGVTLAMACPSIAAIDFCDKVPVEARAAAKEAGKCVDLPGSLATSYAKKRVTSKRATPGVATIGVPDVVGQNVKDATLRLGRFSVQTQWVSDVRPLDQVLIQEPEGGQQAPLASTVILTLSKGDLVPVPPVADRPLAEANALLEKSELQAQTEEVDSDTAMGNVVSQVPSADQVVQRHSVVRLRVSAGVALPGVVGRDSEDAGRVLSSFVLKTEELASTRPFGEVLSQVPEAGTRVSAGTMVTIRVSNASMIDLPALQGMHFAEAQRALQNIDGSAVLQANWLAGSGAVVETMSPPAGTTVERASTVVVTLALPWWIVVIAAITFIAVFAVCAKLWQRKRLRQRVGPDASVIAGIDCNITPIEAVAHGPEVPVLALQAGLQRGPVTARLHEETA
jgi:beta-lactam-binding protein with PASTA domain